MTSRYEKHKIQNKLKPKKPNLMIRPPKVPIISRINKRDKRLKSYFEPIFDPSDTAPFNATPWNISGDKRNYHSMLTAENLLSQLKEFDREVVDNASFDSCDFDGDFSSLHPSFKKCTFDKCDFGLSAWRRARFKRCIFLRTSFSLATFVDCEFRDCKFVEIGFSGNETILSGTLFTNPIEFINNAYFNDNIDLLNTNKTNISYQSMRLDGTKASVSRALLSNLMIAGEEKSFYEISKFNQNQSMIAKMSKTKYDLATETGLNKQLNLLGELILLKSEFMMMNFIGRINNWGESVAKPTLIGIGVIVAFALLYYLTGIKMSAWSALEASIDISLLIGYTKHATSASTNPEKFVFACNMIAGLMWYSVFVPTIIGRVSRIR